MQIKESTMAAGIVWIAIKVISGRLFRGTDNATLVPGLLFATAVLFAFCAGWYKGNMPLKIFLTIQFIALRELAIWAGYSFLYIGKRLIDILVHEAGERMTSAGYLPAAAGVLACLSVALVETIEGVLLFVSIRKIVKICHTYL